MLIELVPVAEEKGQEPGNESKWDPLFNSQWRPTLTHGGSNIGE